MRSWARHRAAPRRPTAIPGAMSSGTAQLLSNLVDVKRSYGPVIINHYNVAPGLRRLRQRAIGATSAASAREVEQIVTTSRASLPRGHDADAAGQVDDDAVVVLPAGPGDRVRRRAGVPADGRSTSSRWLDPFIILTALPGAMAGIVWMLFVTGTTLQRAVADGVDHVDRRGHGQQHPAGDVRQRRTRSDRQVGVRADACQPGIRGCGRC